VSRPPTIKVEHHGAVTLITLARPAALNAFNAEVKAELIPAFLDYDADERRRCLVLTGSDKAFAAGADIGEMAARTFADLFGADDFRDWQQLARIRKPWIAAVAGYALGGGCEVAMMADIIIAADTARFGQPEIRLGVAPGWGGSQRLTRAVGKAKAMDLCLTGRMMDADEAEESGLVARVVPHAHLLDEALDLAAAVAAMSPLAALAAKELVNAAFETTLSEGLRLERQFFRSFPPLKT
jgi:enoyl-CoA hydratase